MNKTILDAGVINILVVDKIADTYVNYDAGSSTVSIDEAGVDCPDVEKLKWSQEIAQVVINDHHFALLDRVDNQARCPRAEALILAVKSPSL